MENESNKGIFTNDISDGSQYESTSNEAIIKVIGVGGGGCNAVKYMYDMGIPNINFVVCNTDKQHLEKLPVPQKLVLGFDITKGLGAGNQPEVGRQCAEASEEELRNLFNDQTEMVFITAGMGGGTGTGAAPVVARLAKESGMLTIGIVTVPFMFEGDKKILKALDGAAELKKHVDALLIINNQNLVELYKDLNFFNAFQKADDTLANAARSISEIISENCYINVDFQDVKTTLKDSGTAIISTAEGYGEHRVSNAINNALHSPLLKAHDIRTSRRLLFKFTCSKDAENPLKTEEIDEIRQFTSQLPPNIDVKWGIADNPEMGDRVKVTVLASGFDVTLKEEEEGTEGGIIFKSSVETNHGESSISTKKGEEQKDKKRIDDIYGPDMRAQQKRDQARNRYVVLTPGQFDDYEVITMLERTPAYNRPTRFKETLRNISEKQTRGNLGNIQEESHKDGGSKIVF